MRTPTNELTIKNKENIRMLIAKNGNISPKEVCNKLGLQNKYKKVMYFVNNNRGKIKTKVANGKYKGLFSMLKKQENENKLFGELHRFLNKAGVPYSAIYVNRDELLSIEREKENGMIEYFEKNYNGYVLREE